MHMSLGDRALAGRQIADRHGENRAPGAVGNLEEHIGWGRDVRRELPRAVEGMLERGGEGGKSDPLLVPDQTGCISDVKAIDAQAPLS